MTICIQIVTKLQLIAVSRYKPRFKFIGM